MVKTRVMFIIDVFYKMAGAEKNLFDVASLLDRAKFEPVVVCFRAGPIADGLRERGVEVIHLPVRKIYSLPALIQAWRLLRLMRLKNIDIVVTYHEGSDYLGGLVAFLARVPVVISSRRDMGYRLKKRHIMLYRVFNRICDRIVTVSDAVCDIIAAREHVPFHKIVTVHNGVDVATFAEMPDSAAARKKLSLPASGVIVGLLAGLRPVKGHRFFLEAAALVARAFPDTIFVMAGPADDAAYRAQLKLLAVQLGIERQALFLSEYADTRAMLAALDISVISSLNEGFSNTILESMAAGKPVVATDSGGTPEAVIDGETGILVPPAHPRALADGMLRLISDAELRRRMGAAGRVRAASCFDTTVMMARLEGLFTSRLSARTRIRATVRTARSLPGRVRSQVHKVAKTALAAGMQCTGISYRVRARSRYLCVLAYHRITDDPFDPLSMNVPPALFEGHLRFLSGHYHLLSLDDAVACMRAGTPLPRAAAVVTFDDGYRDNYLNAFPLLRRYHIPATIFLTVNGVENNETLWYDRVVNAIRRTDRPAVSLTVGGARTWPLTTLRQRYDAAQSITCRLKHTSPDTREAFIRQLQEALGCDGPIKDETSQLLSWDEVREMGRGGMTFGSHGLSHAILTTLSPAEAERDLAVSKQAIEKNTGAPVRMFAYPNGGRADFNPGIEQMLERTGYLGACTLLSGRRNSVSPYAINRYCVDGGMLKSLTGGFSGAIFELEMYKRRFFRSP